MYRSGECGYRPNGRGFCDRIDARMRDRLYSLDTLLLGPRDRPLRGR